MVGKRSSRWIDHRAYLPDRGSVESLGAYLVDQGFSVGPESVVGSEGNVLDFKRMDCPAEIDAVVAPLFDLITQLGGSCDGWGCEVERGIPEFE